MDGSFQLNIVSLPPPQSAKRKIDGARPVDRNVKKQRVAPGNAPSAPKPATTVAPRVAAPTTPAVSDSTAPRRPAVQPPAYTPKPFTPPVSLPLEDVEPAEEATPADGSSSQPGPKSKKL